MPTLDFKTACDILGIDPESVPEGDEYDVVRDAKLELLDDEPYSWDWNYNERYW